MMPRNHNNQPAAPLLEEASHGSLTYALDTFGITLVLSGRGLQDGDDCYDEFKIWMIRRTQL